MFLLYDLLGFEFLNLNGFEPLADRFPSLLFSFIAEIQDCDHNQFELCFDFFFLAEAGVAIEVDDGIEENAFIQF